MAKCCHDLDLLSWMIGSDCLEVSSYGSTSHFNSNNAPQGAPMRCTDGCPVGDHMPLLHHFVISLIKNTLGLPQVLPNTDTATDEGNHHLA